MEPRTARTVIIILSIAAVLLSILVPMGEALPGSVWEAVILILEVGILIAVSYIRFRYWCCPCCGAILPVRGIAFHTAEYCHECGEMLW